MTQYTVTTPVGPRSVIVNAMSVDHARTLAGTINPDHFTDGKDGVWLHVEEVRDAAARFREALANTVSVSAEAGEGLLDLFQEALDEQRENALDMYSWNRQD